MSLIKGQTYIAKYHFICTIAYFFSWLSMTLDSLAGTNGLGMKNITTFRLMQMDDAE